MKKILSMMVVLFVLVGCSSTNDSIDVTALPTVTPTADTRSEVEKQLDNMTLEQKVGQLFFVRPDALDENLSPLEINDPTLYGVTTISDTMITALKQYQVGGIIMFGKNIDNPQQLDTFIQTLQANSVVPLFIGVDEEGGSVSRIANSANFDVPKFSDMQTIGLSQDPQNAYQIGLTIGSYLTQYGLNVDFAPVADINTNPDNLVIGVRSFGSDADLVASMVNAEIDGFHEANIITAVKHFPGHGDTKGDTHDGSVSVDKTWSELLTCEIIPFKAAIDNNVDMVMVSHIELPNVTGDKNPASLSYEIITEKLKNELAFENIIITDSMSMKAITQNYSASDAAVTAILAGVDIILMPENLSEAYNGIIDAVNDGVISISRINESVKKILELKAQYLKNK